MHADDVLSDRYVIEREIARGGMATVYLARDTRHDARVAVKVLHADLGPLAGEARFTREIQMTARLQHPNILPIFDSGRVGGVPFYVMPYVEGETLHERLAREGQLPVEDAVEIACEIADALALAHETGLVHRDVKPSNILLAHGHAMLTDFGIAQLSEITQGHRITETGFTLGTVLYMSPEQGAAGTVDGRSDIYSLACVLYEMLAGHPPFMASNPQAIIARHLIETAPSISAVRPTVSPALDTVIRRAMAKAPADRYARAGDFRDALRHPDAPVRTSEATSTSTRASTHGPTHVVSAADASADSPRDSPSAGHRPRMVVGASIAALLALVVLGWLAGSRVLGRAADPTIADPDHVAVLYFDDESPQHDMGYLADGLTERLIQTLSAVPAIHVVSRSGVQRYRGRAVPLDVMAHALRVGTIVEGSVQRAGDRVRVAVQLVDAGTGEQLATHTVEHPASDLFALEDDVAGQVGDLLRSRLGESIRLREVQEGTSSQPARELLLRADEARNDASAITHGRQPGSVQDAAVFLARSDSLLARAEAADPRWIEPIVERGWTLVDLAALPTSTSRVTRITMLQRALAHADRALARAPTDADALELHGTVLWHLVDAGPLGAVDASRLHRAEQDLRAAVAAKPTQASAWSTLSRLLRLKGSLAEANIAAQRALSEDAYLENAPDIVNQLYRSEMLLGDATGAARACADGHRRFPGDRRFVECRLTLMLVDTASAPNPRAAWALVRSLDVADPATRESTSALEYGPVYRRMAAAAISARAGERDTALATIAWARRQVQRDPNAATDLDYDEAYVRLALGDKDRTLALLRGFLTARPTYRGYIARDPLFTRLRGDPRFTSLLGAPPG